MNFLILIIVTDINGLAQIDGLKVGTKVRIREVTASNGFVNKGESKKITFDYVPLTDVRFTITQKKEVLL